MLNACIAIYTFKEHCWPKLILAVNPTLKPTMHYFQHAIELMIIKLHSLVHVISPSITVNSLLQYYPLTSSFLLHLTIISCHVFIVTIKRQ